MTYRSDKSEGSTAGTETAYPLEFLARVAGPHPRQGPTHDAVLRLVWQPPAKHARQGDARSADRAARDRPCATTRAHRSHPPLGGVAAAAPRALLERLAAGDFEVSVSVPLVLEYEAVARRQSRELGLTQDEIDKVLDFVCRVAHHRQIFFLWRPFLRDAKDDMVLEVAVEARCEYIVTFNLRDFVGVEQFGLCAITPGQFLTLPGGAA